MRFLLWAAAFGLGSLSGAGLLAAIGRVHGAGVAAALVGDLVIVSFVTVSVVTALEGLFPSLRRRTPA